MLTVKSNNVTLDVTIEEALEMQAKLSMAIACAVRQRAGKMHGIPGFHQAMPVIVELKGMPGTFFVNVSHKD